MAVEDIILNRLNYLDRYLHILKKILENPEDDFVDDVILIGSAERYLHLAIESVIDIGNHIVSAEKIGRAQTYSDIFIILTKNKILTQDLGDKLVSMGRFRNRLVHAYLEIDPKVVYNILQEDLKDFIQFKDEILEFLRKKIQKDKGTKME